MMPPCGRSVSDGDIPDEMDERSVDWVAGDDDDVVLDVEESDLAFFHNFLVELDKSLCISGGLSLRRVRWEKM